MVSPLPPEASTQLSTLDQRLARVESEIQHLATKLDLQQSRTELRDELKGDMTSMSDDMTSMRADITSLRRESDMRQAKLEALLDPRIWSLLPLTILWMIMMAMMTAFIKYG